MNCTKQQLIEKAKQGDADAQYDLALIFCIANNKHEATNFFQQAASQGHFKAKEALENIKQLGKQ